MRKITSKAVYNFMNGFNFSESNTTVKVNGDTVRLYLWGNLIAERTNDKLKITLAGYNTNTTRERLNGLPGVRVTQKDFIPYLNGKQINNYDMYEV